MINAVRPQADDEENYRVVARHRKNKGEARPEQLESVVFSLYGEYQNRLSAVGGPFSNTTLSDSDHEVLRENSNHLTLVHFGALRGSILAACRTRKCPYCYQLNASQVDHYLPKAHFGEYSIHAPNLVPICGKCNGKKLNRYTRVGGGRRYLHPYFDFIPTSINQILVAELSVDSAITIEFDIARPNGLSDEIWQMLCTQFADLDLRTRYMEEATEMMMSMLGSYYAHHARGGATELAIQLRIEQNSKTSMYGRNHWWPVTLSTLAASPDFCDLGFMALGPQPDLTN